MRCRRGCRAALIGLLFPAAWTALSFRGEFSFWRGIIVPVFFFDVFMAAFRTVIIGAGEIGGAIEFLLKETGKTVQKWDADPSKVLGQEPLERLIPKAQILFLCVPSWVLRDAMRSIKPFLKSRAIVVFLSKGLDQGGKTVPELAEEMLPGQTFALLSGPMLAEEIKKGFGGAAVAASKSSKARRVMSELFAGSSLRVEASSDVRGVALASVLKNIYAVALGIADGLAWGGNKKGWLADQAIGEMEKIVPMLGGRAKSVLSPAGIADLIATGFSSYSSNRQGGDELVKSGICCKKSEGFVSLPPLAARLGQQVSQFPLFSLLQRVFEQHEDAKAAFAAFFRKES